MDKLLKFLKDEDGEAVEYALITALIAIAIIAGAKALGTNVNAFYQAIADEIAKFKVTV